MIRSSVIDKAKQAVNRKPYYFPIQPPELMPGVVPKGTLAKVAMDDGIYDYARAFQQANMIGGGAFIGFPGYPYLAQLATRAEYRMFAQAIGIQITREWIDLNSTDTKDEGAEEKITLLIQAMKEIDLRNVIEQCAEHDSYYGRAQIALTIKGHDQALPLILSPRTVKLDPGLKNFSIKAVEALWTTPNAYNSSDPTKPDFYKPRGWWMLGQQIHASRLPTIITRPVPDMLKPAFNFGGMSMSQLAEPYVDNWLRTRQSVSDLINNFSIVVLSTAMESVLQGEEGPAGDGTSLFKRAELFTAARSNKGLMLLDKEREELAMLNVPISGLAELQAQSQEQMCSVSGTPATELLGVAPTGFGNISEGEIRARYDRVRAIQETYWRKPIELILNLLQLMLFGKIDDNIVVTFQPLYQMTPKELAEIQTAEANRDAAYLDRGVLDGTEVREKLARDPESGYQGLDLSMVPDGGPDLEVEEEEEGDL